MLLLDEPLGALDAKLRKDLQVDLAALQREVGITFVYVTHDQEEALTMSHRLAVMDAGQVAQVGTPVEVYEQPATAYVADFLGVANLLDADGRGRPRTDAAPCASAAFTLDASGDGAGRPGEARRSDPSGCASPPASRAGPNCVPGDGRAGRLRRRRRRRSTCACPTASRSSR